MSLYFAIPDSCKSRANMFADDPIFYLTIFSASDSES